MHNAGVVLECTRIGPAGWRSGGRDCGERPTVHFDCRIWRQIAEAFFLRRAQHAQLCAADNFAPSSRKAMAIAAIARIQPFPVVCARRIGEFRPIPGDEGTGRGQAAGRNKARTNSRRNRFLAHLLMRLGRHQIWTADMHGKTPLAPNIASPS